jgi:hypothetical protein
MAGRREVWATIANLIAGIMSAIGGLLFTYLSYSDPNPLVFISAVIMFLSGVAWTVSGVLGLRR